MLFLIEETYRYNVLIMCNLSACASFLNDALSSHAIEHVLSVKPNCVFSCLGGFCLRRGNDGIEATVVSSSILSHVSSL